MSHKLYATFENRDAAERAATRMRRKGIAFQISIYDGSTPGASAVKGTRAAVSLLFPYYPPQYSTQFTNMPVPRTLGKAFFTADTLGMPLYQGNTAARTVVTVDDEHLEAARSILRNCGAYDLS